MWKDSETEIDYLDYEYMVNILADIICDDSLLPASIGVYGDWGSGKSSLMHMCIKKLEQEKKTKCLIFNGWLFESYSDAKSALLNSILDAIGDEKKLSEKGKQIISGLYKSIEKLQLAQKAVKFGANWLLTGGVGALMGLTTDAVISQLQAKVPALVGKIDPSSDKSSILQAIKDELNDKSLRDDVREFQKKFAELLTECKIDRLAIFIDELDRCREDTILDTLEAMKLFMFTGKVAFVIGADERHISYAVKSKFKDIEGIQIDIGKEYLEKLVQYPIHIPRMDIDETEVYIALLLLSAETTPDTFKKVQESIKKTREEGFGIPPLKNIGEIELPTDENSKVTECLSISKQVAEVLSKGLHGNPRQIKRFLNTLDMRMNMAKHKHTQLDRRILAKLMMLEYIRPVQFNFLAELAINNQLASELKVLENHPDEDAVSKLKMKTWVKDEWLSSWLETEPLLAEAGERLNPHLYFARTSLDAKISRTSATLSPGAQSVLDGLMSKSDVKINKALKEEVSESEAGLILEAMTGKMITETSIDNKYVKALVEFAKASESRFISAFECVKKLPATALSPASGVYFAEFAKKTNLIQEMQELAATWGKTNPELHKLFSNSLKS